MTPLLLDAEAPLLVALISSLCLLLFTTIAGIDGLYFHLYRYRLYERPASRYEHLLHTINAVLFVPLTALLFCGQPLGLWRWLVAALFLISLAVEVADVRCEKASRLDLGGLTTSEYLMHFLMSGLRFGCVLPLLFGLPSVAWLPEQTALGVRSLGMLIAGASIGIPAIGIAAVHVVLALRKYEPAT
jgi:hypothetical protein